MKSKFIVIEGLEGAGKTTAREAVVAVLRERGVQDIVFTREPGGTPLAEQLRVLVKQGIEGEQVTDKAELLMLYAARVQLVDTVIKPALARGELDRIEQESLRFFERTRERYLALAAEDERILTVDATQPLDSVTQAIKTTLTRWLDRQA